MINNIFEKASKKQAKLRLGIFGASGSGKTYSSLAMAKGLGGKVAVIDTERKSASKYADIFDFFVADLYPANVDRYIDFINHANDYDVLIIDREEMLKVFNSLVNLLEMSLDKKELLEGFQKNISDLEKNYQRNSI